MYPGVVPLNKLKKKKLSPGSLNPILPIFSKLVEKDIEAAVKSTNMLKSVVGGVCGFETTK